MNAILELERLGYTFTLDGNSIHYVHNGNRPDPALVRPLLAELRERRGEVSAFLLNHKDASNTTTAAVSPSASDLEVVAAHLPIKLNDLDDICRRYGLDHARVVVADEGLALVV